MDGFIDKSADVVTDVYKDVMEGSRQIGETLGFKTKSRKTQRGINRARSAAETEAIRSRAPSIDDARRGQMESDRIRRRRGVLANIYGGSQGSNPLVGTKTLLGG